MSEFTYLFRGRETALSPEQMQRAMATWFEWFKALDATGRITDRGRPLAPGGKIIAGKKKLVSDGPYAEAKDVIGGYIVVEATDIDHAVALARGCPILEIGGSVEVRPVETSDQ